MSKFEKRLIIFALVFVIIYLGAAVLTIHMRVTVGDPIERLESMKISTTEGKLLMAELFLPMMILLTLAVCFIVARKQRAKKRLMLDDGEEEIDYSYISPPAEIDEK
ncbi:hypothetical protein D1AOALGA4SA_1059 [Olavius algarvensis Delta 1 endosymbiont]|nr:hypothetical protein D1AOALGA4SA_1059 [Olavius algarvensis Delta 1 endosymbiont]